jgi:hypothetical protein
MSFFCLQAAAKLDFAECGGELGAASRARATIRRRRRRRLQREGRLGLPTLDAQRTVLKTAVRDVRARLSLPAAADELDSRRTTHQPSSFPAPRYGGSTRSALSVVAGHAENQAKSDTLATLTENRDDALLVQVSAQFFRNRQCRSMEFVDGVWVSVSMAADVAFSLVSHSTRPTQRVLYSNHSSRCELQQFVSFLKPKSIKPFLLDVRQ